MRCMALVRVRSHVLDVSVWSTDDTCDAMRCDAMFLFVVSIRYIYNWLTFGLHVNKVLLRRDREILNALLKGYKLAALVHSN